jgi:hypothetical protein
MKMRSRLHRGKILNDAGTMGVAVDRSPFYFTTGLAFGEVNNSVQYNSSKFPTFNTPSYNLDSSRLGWVGGSGLEYAVTPNWTVKGEAIYAQLNTLTASWVSHGSPAFPANAVYNTRFNTSVAVVRAGLNYKFDGFACYARETKGSRSGPVCAILKIRPRCTVRPGAPDQRPVRPGRNRSRKDCRQSPH